MGRSGFIYGSWDNGSSGMTRPRTTKRMRWSATRQAMQMVDNPSRPVACIVGSWVLSNMGFIRAQEHKPNLCWASSVMYEFDEDIPNFNRGHSWRFSASCC